MPITTETATRVYVKKENPTGLLQAYTGPDKIVERPGHSTLKVRMGTFKSGVENLYVNHWQNCKPAKLREGAKEAEMPTRGGPKKTAPLKDSSEPPEVRSEPTMPFNKEPVRLPKQTKEAKVNRLLPNRPSECIPNINETSPPKHSVDSLEEVMADKKDNAIYTASHPNELLLSRVDIPLPTLTSPLTQLREFSPGTKDKESPHHRYNKNMGSKVHRGLYIPHMHPQVWTATRQELKILNASITFRPYRTAV